mgnify:CR=1 FL=1
MILQLRFWDRCRLGWDNNACPTLFLSYSQMHLFIVQEFVNSTLRKIPKFSANIRGNLKKIDKYVEEI